MKGESLPRLLIFELRLMGDAVMSLPFLRAAHGHFEVHVCCSPAAEPIFRMVLPAAQIHPWNPVWREKALSPTTYPLKLLRDLRGLLGRLRRLEATHTLCGWCDPRIEILMNLVGAPLRISFPAAPVNFYGYHLPWRQKQLSLARVIERCSALLLGHSLLTTAVQRQQYGQHHVEDWQQMADALGLAMDTRVPCLGSDTVGQPARPCASRRRIILHPGASEPQKRWPLQCFLQLARSLDREYEVVIIEPPELDFDPSVREDFTVARTTGIAELVMVLREADVLIGNDTGVAHLADAMGKPVISLFLSSEPGHFAPYGSRQFVISFPGSCEVRPCYGRCTKPEFICHVPATYEAVVVQVRTHLGALFEPGRG